MEESNWQIGLSTIRERAKYAFNNSLFCDIEFLVADSDGDIVILSANKFILAVTSPVFAAMFYGQLAETKLPIILPDCTKEGFQELLRFAYSEEVNLSGMNLMEVMYLADKYMIPSLAVKCSEYFKKKVRPQNVFQMLPEVSKLNDKTYEELCWEVVDKETQQAFHSSLFLGISRELLCQVLGRDGLRVKELVLFQAVDRWASKKVEEKGLESTGETKRDVLGEDVIKLIRFPLMSQKEFAEVVLPTKILNLDEVTEMIQNFNQLSVVTTDFSRKDRGAKDRLLIPTDRFDTILERFTNSANYSILLCFKVNKSVYLHGFRMFGSVGCTYNVDAGVGKMSKSHSDHKNLPLQRENKDMEVEDDKIDDCYYGFTFNFLQPSRLYAGQVFAIICVCKKINDSPQKPTLLTYGCNQKSVVTCEDLEITYCHQELMDKYSPAKDIVGGQIQSLIFTNINE